MAEDATSQPSQGALPVQEPSNKTWVPYSEALTWFAFRHSLGDVELRRAVEGASTPELKRKHNRARTSVIAKERKEEAARKAAKEPPKRILFGQGEMSCQPRPVRRAIEDWWYEIGPAPTHGAGPFADRDAELQRLESAQAELCEAMDADKLSVRARHVPSGQKRKRTQPEPPEDLKAGEWLMRLGQKIISK